MTVAAGAEGTAAAPGRWRAAAFGLEIDLSFPAPGLPIARGRPAGPRTRADLAPEAELESDWPRDGSKRVLAEHGGKPRPERTIDVHPDAGYRLYARHFGLARISPDGARILCSPPDVEPWRWQRFLVGRVLPWAAVLRGLEAFHASAVAIGGRVAAFVGPTGAGKTSLAVQLVARGAGFVTDDVLALDERSGELRAHPGAAIASVRPQERAAIPPSTWRRVGSVLGHSEKTYLALPREEGPLPLGAMYFLRADDGPAVERVERPDPPLLLASAFVLGIQTPARLENQLHVCATLARTVPLYWLRKAPGLGAERLAEIAETHARGVLARTAVGVG